MTQVHYAIERDVGVWVRESPLYPSEKDAEERMPKKLAKDHKSGGHWRIVEVKTTVLKEYVS